MKKICLLFAFCFGFVSFVSAGPSPDPSIAYRTSFTLMGDVSSFSAEDPFDADDDSVQLRMGLTRRLSPGVDAFLDYRRSRFERDNSDSIYDESGNSMWLGLRFHSDRDKPGWFELSLAGFYSGISGSTEGNVYEREVSVVGAEIGFATRYSRNVNPAVSFHVFPFVHVTGYGLFGSESVEEMLHGLVISDESDSGLGEANLELRLGLCQLSSNFFIFGFGENFVSEWNDLSIITYGVGIETGGTNWFLLAKGKFGDQSQDYESYSMDSSGSGFHTQLTFKF